MVPPMLGTGVPTAALKDLPFCSYYFVTDAADDTGVNKGEKDRSALWTVALRAGDFCLTPVLWGCRWASKYRWNLILAMIISA